MDSDAAARQEQFMVERSTTISDNPIDPAGGRRWHQMPRPAGLAASIALVATALLIAHLTRTVLPPGSLMLIALAAVLVSAVGFGFWTGLAAAGLAFLGYNFFFVEPLYTFAVNDAADIQSLAVFLLVAGLTGFLAGRMREEADSATGRAAMLTAIAGFSGEIATATDRRAVEHLLVRHLASTVRGEAVLLEQASAGPVVNIASPEGLQLKPDELQAAERAIRRGAREDATATGWPGHRFSFVPLPVESNSALVIGYAAAAGNHRDVRFREQAVDAIIRQGAVALARADLAVAMEAQRAKAEREALRSALLSSLSHDLRTPLATILGSVTSLRELDEALPPAARADLLLAIEEETSRLTRYVDNLLQMTRLQAGLDLKLDWIDAGDSARSAVARARRAFPDRRIEYHAAADLPLIRANGQLLEQALFNLIDNAAKFSEAGGEVAIVLGVDGDHMQLAVSDHGCGIPADERAHIFEPFFRGAGHSTGGTGLGLAVTHGIVQALGGSIVVTSPTDGERGTAVSIRLPIERRPSP